MDKLISKSLWLFVGVYLFITCTCAQDRRRSLPISSRRRLPTVIITREHLRQRQNSYGTYGDTAAEFVVSAGLDTSKNSAVMIRRIGNKPANATHSTRPNVNGLDFPSVNGTRRVSHAGIAPDQEYRTPSFQNADERNGIPHTGTSINRRYHSNVGDRNRQHLDDARHSVRFPDGRPYLNYNRHQIVPERTYHQYRPPIFVPHYQQNRRSDANIGTEEVNRRFPNVVVGDAQRRNIPNEQVYPVVSVKYSTSSVSATISQKQHAQRHSSSTADNMNKKFQLSTRNNNKPEIHMETVRRNNQQTHYLSYNNSHFQLKEKPSSRQNNTNDLHASKLHTEKSDFNKENVKITSINDNKALKSNDKSEIFGNKAENAHDKTKEEANRNNNNTTKDVVSRNPVTESVNPVKSTETSPVQFNIDKIREFQTRLIRKPSFILRDQITVNELPRMSSRPRFGPRSLEDTNEKPAVSRKKRQTENGHVRELPTDAIFNREKANTFDNVGEVSDRSKYDNLTRGTIQRKGRYNSQRFRPQFTRGKTNGTSETPTFQPDENESRVVPVYEMFSDGTYDNNEGATSSDIMSFSDFLASPLAEKIRLERQFFFKDGNISMRNSSAESSRIHFDPKTLKNNTIVYLKNLVNARLLDSILNLSTNDSSNSTKNSQSGRSSDGLTSAEQRHIGIMVTPYEGQESVQSHISSKPAIRVLKGRIVTLPEIPPELIPIILGTYKPTYTNNEPEEPIYDDDDDPSDPNLTDNIIDNAIYKLLQNDELLNLQPIVRKPHRPITFKVSRKSPSTNYIGSLKSNEPVPKPKFTYKPSEWSLEPRCDRLTEEICLDDSDYPSSAIMTSIYKDKSKFDLMYAEVKVHESQVEGLSRQQETAYSFDHYYGSYPHGSGSSYSPREYGPSGGFVCPSEVHYARPHRAKNRKGEWKVVVNVGDYTQTLRMEKCLSSGNPCKYVVNNMQSTCAQVYSYHRLLVFSKEKGLHIDVFRVPAACTCYLRSGQKTYNPNIAASAPYLVRPNHYEEYGGHVETAPSPQIQAESPSVSNEKKRKNFSNTLWAILGGGQQASALAQQPQFLDEVQKQITWTQQLKHFPHLMKQISPNQVLKQLLEEDEEDYSIRRQRIRQKHQLDQLMSGGFASHQVPIVVPLPPPPPPPPGSIPRRPVVSMVPVDQKHVYAPPPREGASKIIAISSSEPTKVFSLTKDPNRVKMRPSSEAGHRNIYVMSPQSFHRMNTFKVHPGMYPPQSENVQIPESSLLPVAPQFSSHPDNPLKTIMKPIPAPRGSKKNIVEDEDLMAAEKSVSEGVDSFAVESDERDGIPQDDNDPKINFSYHPILEYLNV